MGNICLETACRELLTYTCRPKLKFMRVQTANTFLRECYLLDTLQDVGGIRRIHLDCLSGV
jgi:hypothetical protein